MVKIQAKGNLIDIEAPFFMNDEDFDNFCKKLQEITGQKIEVVPTAEKERWAGITERQKPKKWQPEELLLLLSPLEHTELERKLKRSDMSLVLKQGDFVPKFTAWAKKNGYAIQDISASVIKKYLEEFKDEDS